MKWVIVVMFLWDVNSPSMTIGEFLTLEQCRKAIPEITKIWEKHTSRNADLSGKPVTFECELNIVE